MPKGHSYPERPFAYDTLQSMRLTRRALFGIPFTAIAQPRRRPNVIVFMTDDHGA